MVYIGNLILRAMLFEYFKNASRDMGVYLENISFFALDIFAKNEIFSKYLFKK